jgi:transcriptional regulator with XRE-family HTH domain
VLPVVQLVREAIAAMERREGHHLSLREIAERRGVSYGTLRRYQDVRLAPLRVPARPQTINELALALDLPKSALVDAFERSTIHHYTSGGKPGPRVSIAALDALDEADQRRELALVLKWAKSKGLLAAGTDADE